MSDQLAPLAESAKLVRVALDPEHLLDTADLSTGCEIAEVDDWFDLRKAWEEDGRRRGAGRPPLLIVLRSEEMSDARDLPWDISQAVSTVRVRLPVPETWRDLVADLPDELSDRAVTVISSPDQRDVLAAVVSALWGAVVPAAPDPVRELECVVRLRTDTMVPPSLWPLVRLRLVSELASGLAQEPPNFDQIQAAWDEWLHDGDSSEWDAFFRRVGTALAPFFISGALRASVPRAAGLPTWARIGSRSVGCRERLEELLAARPEPWPPQDFSNWSRAAAWWGEVRASLSKLVDPGGLGSTARETWAEMDAAFVAWLRARLWTEMQSGSSPPHSVDKIAGFLATKLRDGTSSKVLLIVLDGMAFSQWSTIRTVCDFKVVSSSACLAMVPTLTPFSRQAIFAGSPPLKFPDTLASTSKDGVRWADFWVDAGFDVGSVRYVLSSGGAGSELPDLGGARIGGIVISAVDELLHSAKVVGDPEVTAGVRAWAERGYLRSVVETAIAESYEVWFTSDHGNLEIRSLGAKQEGLAVDTAGVRVRLYATAALRNGSRLDGIVWDPPSLPSGSVYCLFVPASGGYFTGDVRVTHGGLSLDEVMVPLVQVTL